MILLKYWSPFQDILLMIPELPRSQFASEESGKGFQQTVLLGQPVSVKYAYGNLLVNAEALHVTYEWVF